jgi:hypothetical protein
MCTNKIIKSFLGTISGTISSLFLISLMTDWTINDEQFLLTVSCGGLSGGLTVFCFDNNDIITITQNGIIGGSFGSLFVINSIKLYNYLDKKKRRHKMEYIDYPLKINNNQQQLDLFSKYENNCKLIENKNKIIENKYMQMNNEFMDIKSRLENLNCCFQTLENNNYSYSNKILNGNIGILITNIGIAEIKTAFTIVVKLFLCNLTINDQFKISSKEGSVILNSCVFKLDPALLKEYHLELSIYNKSINRYYLGTSELIYFDKCNNSVVIKYKFDDGFIVPLCYPFYGVLTLSISFYVI